MNWSIIGGLLSLTILISYLLRQEIKRVAKLRVSGLRTQGIVTGHKLRIRRSSTIHPLISFTTKRGQLVEVEGKIGLAVPVRSKGDQVVVLYDEENPSSILLEDETDETAPYMGIVIVWMLFFAVLVALWQAP